MKLSRIFLLSVFICACVSGVRAQAVSGPQKVIVTSGSLRLRAHLWRPKASGSFPAILFSPGSGQVPDPRQLGEMFARRGYVFFALYRSGQGPSAQQGEESARVWNRERVNKGDDAANRLQLQLLEGEQLDQTQEAYDYLRTLAFVDGKKVSVLGHSFGGSLALLLAERNPSLRSVVTFGAAAGSWPRSAYLRERLITAVQKLTTPVLLVYTANEYSITPGEVLDAELTRLSKPHRLKVFPEFGKTPAEGHNLLYLAMSSWEAEVFTFLGEHVR